MNACKLTEEKHWLHCLLREVIKCLYTCLQCQFEAKACKHVRYMHARTNIPIGCNFDGCEISVIPKQGHYRLIQENDKITSIDDCTIDQLARITIRSSDQVGCI